MNDRPLALVFTMEKVGSSTVMNALRSIGRNPERGYSGNIDHLHPLSKYEKVISMVRDPVARNASMFFEILTKRVDSYSPALLDIFITSFDHHGPLNWFDIWISPYFGDEILTDPFSKKKGWQIYNDRFLLIQTESLKEKLPEAFAALFDVGASEVHISHDADTFTTRKYGEVYREFLDNLKLPKNLLDEIYRSEFMDHFYYKKEIAEFRKRWS